MKKEENTVTSTSFGLRHSLAMLQMAKPLFFILLNQILLRRLANSYVLSIRLLPSVVNFVFKNTLRRFKVTWFRHMGNTLFYCCPSNGCTYHTAHGCRRTGEEWQRYTGIRSETQKHVSAWRKDGNDWCRDTTSTIWKTLSSEWKQSNRCETTWQKLIFQK